MSGRGCATVLEPKVACVMPTMGRPEMAQRAVKMWKAQDYRKQSRFLVILDDNTNPSLTQYDSISGCLYFRTSQDNLGLKRNEVNELAVDHVHPDLIMHWDDDDLYAQNRISAQVNQFLSGEYDLTGFNSIVFWDVEADTYWQYKGPSDLTNLGVSFCYTPQVWKRHPFPKKHKASDMDFAWSIRKHKYNIRMFDGSNLIVATTHRGSINYEARYNQKLIKYYKDEPYPSWKPTTKPGLLEVLRLSGLT